MTSPAQQLLEQLQTTSAQVIYGVNEVSRLLSIALLSRGHVLLQGVPGLGKTLLAKTLTAQLGGDFKRIQCTADLMPSDMTGIHIYDAKKQSFTLTPGPVFTDVLLVDEVNRASPKTQSALLQAMEELKVTIDRDTYDLPEDFFVIATQNPHEFEGTFPLPESQLDRFLMLIEMEYLATEDELLVLKAYDKPASQHIKTPNLALLDKQLLTQAREQVAQVHVSDEVYQYVVQIAQASRVHPQVNLGLSNRGSLAIMRCARAAAAIRSSEFVSPDDIKSVCQQVMSHRLLLSADAALDGITPNLLVDAILNQVDIPRGQVEPNDASINQ